MRRERETGERVSEKEGERVSEKERDREDGRGERERERCE